MIELMYEYTNKLQERVKKTNHSAALNLQPVSSNSLSGGLADFTNRRMAVMMMMMCVDSATAESGNDCNLMGAVRDAATSLVGEVVVVEEAWNSIVVAVEPNSSQPTGTPVAQLVSLIGQIIKEVHNTHTGNSVDSL